MKAVVLGLGISGKAAVNYLKKRGDQVIGVDRQEPGSLEIEVMSDQLSPQLDGIELVVKSPGISHTHPWVKAAKEQNIPVVGEIDLAFTEFKNRDKKVFGITGSNGKTTTTLLATHFFNLSGIKAMAAGNVGVPLLDLVDHDAEVFVVELSSFQLENILPTQVLAGGAILNLTPNHLDRHRDLNEYVLAKSRISQLLKHNAPLYLSRQVAKLCLNLPCNYTIFEEEKEMVETILSLGYRDNLYPHDIENVSAAYMLARPIAEIFKKGIETFIRPPHRLEFVCEKFGLKYVNDSKATSVDAVIKGVEAIKGPIHLIAGGVDKGGAFAEWIPFFRKKVAQVWAIGEAAPRIQRELMPEIAVHIVSSLEAGIAQATQKAVAGSTILLSPGCSSYDQFKDYQHRGEMFRQIVMRQTAVCKELL